MKKLVYSAIALSLASLPSFGSDSGWAGLDQKIDELSSSLSLQNPTGPKIGGWVITSYRHSSDIDLVDPIDAPDTDNLSGFQLDSVRVELEGDAGAGYSYKISWELSGGTVVLRDAYASWEIYEGIKGRFGNFKQPFLRQALISDNRLLFLERSGLGAAFATRQLGFMVSGQFDVLSWWIAAQNGADGQLEDHVYTGRLVANLMGNGTEMVEGAYGATDETDVTVGVAVADDGSFDKGVHFAVEASMTTGPFSLSGNVVSLDDDIAARAVLPGEVAGGDSRTPWDVTASYMFTDMYEVGGRYQDADDDADTTQWGVVVNRYTQGHDIKWQLEWLSNDSDNDAGDFDLLGLGLAVTF